MSDCLTPGLPASRGRCNAVGGGWIGAICGGGGGGGNPSSWIGGGLYRAANGEG